jgi:hypothetical protein
VIQNANRTENRICIITVQYSLGQPWLIKPTKRRFVRLWNICTAKPTTAGHYSISQTALMPFKILNRAFMFLRCGFAVERAEIFSFIGSRILLA